MEATRTRWLGWLAAAGFLAAGCEPPADVPVDVSGLWSLYRTYDGGIERGPDPTAWTLSEGGNNTTGYAVGMRVVCSAYVLSDGEFGVYGGLRDHDLALSSPHSQWSGTIAGSSMSGTFTDGLGSGTWRAVRSAAAVCDHYEVWGGAASLGCGSTAGYYPETNGYTFLGRASTTQTFGDGAGYAHFVVVTRDFDVARVDAVSCSDGVFYGTNSTGNTTSWQNLAGPPDGLAAIVGADRWSGGGYVMIDPAVAVTSITVYVARPN